MACVDPMYGLRFVRHPQAGTDLYGRSQWDPVKYLQPRSKQAGLPIIEGNFVPIPGVNRFLDMSSLRHNSPNHSDSALPD